MGMLVNIASKVQAMMSKPKKSEEEEDHGEATGAGRGDVMHSWKMSPIASIT
jgi:hypothetical protein